MENGVSVFQPGEELFREKYNVTDIIQQNSKTNEMIQTADFFAGIASFSHNNYSDFAKWLENNLNGNPLFHVNNDRSFEKKIKKFELMKHLDEECKKCKMGVSLKKMNGFWTPKPETSLNFWLFESQHELPNAPTALSKKPTTEIRTGNTTLYDMPTNHKK